MLGEFREGGVGAALHPHSQRAEGALAEGDRVAAAVRLRRESVAVAMQLQEARHGAAADAELLGHFIKRARAAFVSEDKPLAQVS